MRSVPDLSEKKDNSPCRNCLLAPSSRGTKTYDLSPPKPPSLWTMVCAPSSFASTATSSAPGDGDEEGNAQRGPEGLQAPIWVCTQVLEDSLPLSAWMFHAQEATNCLIGLVTHSEYCPNHPSHGFFFFFFFFCFLFFFVPSPAWSDIVQKPLHLLWLLQLQLSSIHRIDAQESSGRLPVRSAWPAPFPFALGEAEGKAPSVQPCRSTKEARSGEHGIDELNTCLL